MVRARALLACNTHQEALLLTLHAYLRRMRAVSVHRLQGRSEQLAPTSADVCCWLGGRPQPTADLTKLQGMAFATITRMLVCMSVRCVRHGRAERAGRGLLSLPACLK